MEKLNKTLKINSWLLLCSLAILLFLEIVIITVMAIKINNLGKQVETIKLEEHKIQDELYEESLQFLLKDASDGLMDALNFYNVPFKDWVYCQAIAETNIGATGVGKSKNNLFGLYDSSNNCFFNYEYWWESVTDYKARISIRYDSTIDKSYPDFLNRIGYAEDPLYIEKVKRIHYIYFEI